MPSLRDLILIARLLGSRWIAFRVTYAVGRRLGKWSCRMLHAEWASSADDAQNGSYHGQSYWRTVALP